MQRRIKARVPRAYRTDPATWENLPNWWGQRLREKSQKLVTRRQLCDRVLKYRRLFMGGKKTTKLRYTSALVDTSSSKGITALLYLNRAVDDDTARNSAGVPACALDIDGDLPPAAKA